MFTVGDVIEWLPQSGDLMFAERGSDEPIVRLAGKRVEVTKGSVVIVLCVIELPHSLNKKLKVITNHGLVGWVWSQWMTKI